ncbi:unnamed protein product [Bemisia tabaci]|uniref:RRM domain-containing protein n=1 Tax=Bemisia tabaci TaxID=7038 RepID=A0A9P0AKK2_BEMTA|nr:unnamed protein product [Bemisia tabaci]
MTDNGLPLVMSPVQLVPFQYSMPPPPMLMGPPPPPPISTASGAANWGISAEWQGLLCQQVQQQQMHQQQMQQQQQMHQQIQQQMQQQQKQLSQQQPQQPLVAASVASYSMQMPWANGGVQLTSSQRNSPYSRPPTTMTNDGFAVPWPPRARFNRNSKSAPNKFRRGNEGSTNGEARRRRKKKSLFEEYISTKPWNKEDAVKALTVETDLMNERTEKTVIIRFPDPDLSKSIVQRYHPDIKSVHFQAPSDQRFCYVHLEDDVDVDEVIESLNKTKFGTGYLSAERKPVTNQKCDSNTDVIECIDPYTLYVGNLPANTTTMTLLEHFPTSTIIKISQEQRVISHMWAFVAFKTVDLAIEALKSTRNLKIDSRNIAVRFRRGAKPLNSKNKEQAKDGSNSKETSKQSQEMIEPKKEPIDDYERIRGVEIDDEYDEPSVDDELDSVMGDYDQDYDDDDEDVEFVAPNGYHDQDFEEDDDEVMAFHSLPLSLPQTVVCKKEEKHFSHPNDVDDEDDDDDTDVWRLR